MIKTYEAKVEGLGIIHRVAKPFDEALKTIKSAKANLISVRDLVYARIQEGSNSSLCTNGSYIKEGVVYIPDKSLLVRNSPLLNQKLAKKATDCHRNGNEFDINNKLVDKYREQAEADKNKSPEKRRVLSLNKRGNFKIPTNRFKDDELTLWLFKDQAENYGNLLEENSINEMPAYLTGNNKEKFANQLWLSRLSIKSELYGSSRGLSYDYWLREVLNSVEGNLQKNSRKLPYTPKQLTKISQVVERVRQGNLPASKLEKVLDFFENLK